MAKQPPVCTSAALRQHVWRGLTKASSSDLCYDAEKAQQYGSSLMLSLLLDSLKLTLLTILTVKDVTKAQPTYSDFCKQKQMISGTLTFLRGIHR